MLKYNIILILSVLSFAVYSQTDSDSAKQDTLSKMLDGVTVTAQRKVFEQKVDRIVFNVENSTLSAGGDALDALKVTPNIQIQNGVISMIGKNRLAVMVDERLVQLSGEPLADYLKSIPHSRISKIEVITTPPAKYDAEGNSGIVNIILKKAKNDSWNMNLRASLTQASYLFGNSGADFNFQKGKWTLFSSITLGYRQTISESNQKYLYPTEYWEASIFNENKTHLIGGNLGLGYKITENLTIGFQYFGYANKQKTVDTGDINIFNNSYMEVQNALYQTQGNSTKHYNNHSINFNISQKLDTLGKYINFDFDYFTNSSSTDNLLNSTCSFYNPSNFKEYYNTTNDSRPKISNFAARLDFYLPYKWGTLNYGGKISFTKNNAFVYGDFYKQENNSDSLYLAQQNHFTYSENIQALYFSIEKKLTQHWTAKAGIRMESTQNKGISESQQETPDTNSKKYCTFVM
ncbi:hypothetical protein FACS1894180_3010 [Bacteroidia bacterium]|nr:hypothetical protein FACS1894180_3010 [Bacteroidia bacterium]